MGAGLGYDAPRLRGDRDEGLSEGPLIKNGELSATMYSSCSLGPINLIQTLEVSRPLTPSSQVQMAMQRD